MKNIIRHLALITPFLTTIALFADDAERLTGKWSAKRANDEGQKSTQTVEIKKDKFTFQVLDADDRVVLHAEGDVKLEKLGPFNVIRFVHIRGGTSSSDLNDVDDEYNSIYTLDSDSWTLAMNFDKERDQKPRVENYTRLKSAAPGGAEGRTLVIDEIKIADTPQSATWFFCFEATVDGATKRYYVENKGYDKNQVTIPLALEVPKVKAGQKCSFKMQLDDVDGDTCGDDMDNRSTGDFSVSEKGSQTYKPESNWSYTIRWHLK